MTNDRFACASTMLQGDTGPLAAGLEQLKQEHIPLTKQMKDFYAVTQEIEENVVPANYETLQQLYKQVKQFVTDLDPHSEREEGVLFEMVAAYIGREMGPIAVMEYEHDTAKGLLRKFLEETEKSTEAITAAEVKQIAQYAAEAYLILTDHFMKEENVLFPLANQLLTDDEKALLKEKINVLH